MFLICTADETYWASDRPVLFLGEWCRLYERRHVWSGLQHEVLPYHWDDRDRLWRDYEYVRGVAQHCLATLVPQLNRLHGTHHPPRFWDIVLGNWLNDFIAVCLDRYLSIAAAGESGRVTDCVIPAAGSPAGVAPAGTAGMMARHVSVEFNTFLFGEIIRRLRPFSFQESPAPAVAIASDAANSRGGTARFLRRVYGRVSRLAPTPLRRVALIDAYFTPDAELRLLAPMLQLPAVAPQLPMPAVPPDPSMRAALRLDLGDRPFERLVSDLVPAQLPRSGIESFARLSRAVRHAFPGGARTIVTANAHLSSDAFKVWAAGKTTQRATLLIHQHGGQYGIAKISGTEDYETRVADRFLSWGWTDASRPAVQPVPASKLVGIERRVRTRPGGDILIGSNSTPLQFYRFASMPVGHQHLRFMDDHVRFLTALPPEVYRLCLLRLYPAEYGWNEPARYRARLPDLRIADSREPLYRQLGRSRLFVCTNNHTMYLETLAANLPTVLFWDPRTWETRDAATPWLDGLRQARILHDTPDGAATLVTEIAKDPASWWAQPRVQAARAAFCERFARTDREWRRAWRLLLQGRGGSSGS